MFDKKDTGKYWDFGWQLIEGCTKYSPGCANCWSLAKEKRFRKEIGIVFHEERLNRPMLRKKPASYAIWNDLFHEEISFDQALEVLFIAEKCPQHIFMILTKRPERMREFFTEWAPNPFFEPLPNVWLGVTSENQEQADKRIPILLEIPAKVRFVSCEPLLGEINISKYLSNENNRENNLSSDNERRMDNRENRSNLEVKRIEENKGGAQNSFGLYANKKNDKQEKISRRSAQNSVDAFQRRNSTEYDNQSQEWNKERQQIREFRINDTQAKQHSCDKNFESRESSKSKGSKKQYGEINRGNNYAYPVNDPGYTERKESSRKNNDSFGKKISSKLRYNLEGSERNVISINQIIAGPETCPGKRECKKEWIESLYSQCKDANVPFFDKKDILGLNIKQYPR